MTTTSHSNQIQPTKVDLFTISVDKFHINEWESKKDHVLGMIPESNDFENHIKYSDYLDPYGNLEYRKEFLSIIEPYLKELHKTSIYKFKEVSNMWCQRYDKRDYMVPHDHGGCGYACVFYAKLTEEHDGTLFFSSFADVTGIRQCRSVPVVEGDLLVFPSNLMHMAAPHNSDEERVIISFNLQ
nr:hypothetical protein [uncultured Mediterranean phage uvMED]